MRSVLLVAERIGRIEVNATEYHMQAIRLLPLSTWRVIYFLDNERKVLLMVKIDRRGRVYR